MSDYDQILYDALDAPLGVVVATEDVEALRQKLYVIRRKNPLFEPLSFLVSPTNPNGELWIVKKAQADEEERGT